MASRLTENLGASRVPIGAASLLHFIDEMNERRAAIGLRERYRPVTKNGLLTFEAHWQQSSGPSPRYAGLKVIEGGSA